MAPAGPQSSPSNAEVWKAATEIRRQSPSLGLPKLLAAIKSEQPAWQLSEKASPQPISPIDDPEVEKTDAKTSGIRIVVKCNFKTNS